MYDECDEVADALLAAAPRFDRLSDALFYVREQLGDESETIICNVAESLFAASCHKGGTP